MSPVKTATGDDAASRRRRVERLIRQLAETERELQQLGAGELDAVVDRDSATAILLKGAQQAISQSEARFRDLVNRCPALVCEIDREGKLIFVNAAAKALLGVDPDDVAAGGMSWLSLIVAESTVVANRMIVAAERGDITGLELPLRTAAADTRWLLFNTANRYDGAGKLEMIVAFGVDITERRRAEEAARMLAEAEHARSEAEAANKAKTDFLAVMSHELRTPLNAIAGYAELIEMGLRGPVTTEQAEDLRKIRRSQRHLLGLINDIMNFARLEAGHVSIRPKDVAVNETLITIAMLTEPQIAAKGIRYMKDECEPGLTVWADEEKTRQILINLMSNAIKFTPSGGTITLECTSDDNHVFMRVSDTGPGIAPEKLEAIFEPFVQLNKQFTRDEGVGLGLAISRDLARMMGGDLMAESVVDRGSSFTLTLPRHM